MEIENEIKFLLREGYRKEEGISDWAKKFVLRAMRMDRHLLVYYDYKDYLLKTGSTFRISYRKVDGVNKGRVTFKKQINNKDLVRVANEYHSSITKDINGFKQSILLETLPPEFKDLSLFYLERQCWLLVQRYRLNIGGNRIDLDICKTNRGIYFEELEIENPDLNDRYINYLIHNYKRSLLNKYERTRILNEEDITREKNKI